MHTAQIQHKKTRISRQRMTGDYRPMAFYVPPLVREALVNESLKRGVSMSQIVVEALREHGGLHV